MPGRLLRFALVAALAAGPAAAQGLKDALDDLLFVGNSLQTDSGYLTVVDCAKEQVLTVLPIGGTVRLWPGHTIGLALYSSSCQPEART